METFLTKFHVREARSSCVRPVNYIFNSLNTYNALRSKQSSEIESKADAKGLTWFSHEYLRPQGKAFDGYIFTIFLISYNVPNVGIIY